MSQSNDKQPALSNEQQAVLENFMQKLNKTTTVWGLSDGNDWAVCPSVDYEDSIVYPFWSDKAAAKTHCVNEWAKYAPAAIALDSFIYNWLRGMNEDDILVGLDWDADLTGLEMEPLELAGRLVETKNTKS